MKKNMYIILKSPRKTIILIYQNIMAYRTIISLIKQVKIMMNIYMLQNARQMIMYMMIVRLKLLIAKKPQRKILAIIKIL